MINFFDKKGLPEYCFSTLMPNEIVMIRRYQMGCVPVKAKDLPRAANGDADAANKLLGITEAQINAMDFGSVLGWDGEFATPVYWEVQKVSPPQADQSEMNKYALKQCALLLDEVLALPDED